MKNVFQHLSTYCSLTNLLLPMSVYMYSSSAVAQLCRTCPLGFTTENFTSSALSVCSACYPGYYSEDPSKACQLCPMGYYSNIMKSNNCTFCPSGYTFHDPPAISCVGCEPGQYGNFTVNQMERTCSVCIGGKHSGFGASACEGCPIGYISKEGSVSCKQCVSGKISSSSKDRCEECSLEECDSDGKSCENKDTFLPEWRTNSDGEPNYEWPPMYFNISTTTPGKTLRTCRRQICDRDFVVLDLTNASAAAVYRSSEVTILPSNATSYSSAYSLYKNGSAQIVQAVLGEDNTHIVDSIIQLGCFPCPTGFCDHVSFHEEPQFLFVNAKSFSFQILH